MKTFLLIAAIGAVLNWTPALCLADCTPTASVNPTISPDLDQKAFAEATKLGMKLDATWSPNHVELFRAKANFPVFVLLGAEVSGGQDEGDYVNVAFFKKDPASPMKLAFTHGHPGLSLVFSPSGKQLLIQNYYSAAHEESYVLPVAVFDTISETERFEVKPFYLTFHFAEPKGGIELTAVAKAAIPAIRQCGHLYVTGDEWLDETHIKAHVSANYCKDQPDSEIKVPNPNRWDGVFNLVTLKLEKLKATKD